MVQNPATALSPQARDDQVPDIVGQGLFAPQADLDG
jgi:hypothetical protein